MDKKEQIRRSLQDLAHRFGPMSTLLGEVVSVDEDELTCELVADEIEIYDVRLRPVINGNESVTIFPTVGSWVLALRIENDEDWMVIATDTIDKYRITTGTQVFEMDGSKFLIKNAGDDLKTMMDDLFNAILAMKFTTNTGVTIELINATAFETLKTRFENLLKSS
jgi:hypothetical protein